MPKRPRGTLLPLLADSGAASLRAQIYTSCVQAMLDGRLRPGARLPSARQLARDWNVSRNTVDDAIAQLQAEGFVVRRVGAGTFVAAHLPATAPRGAPVRLRRPNARGREAIAAASQWSRATAGEHSPRSVPRPRPFVAGLPALDEFPFELWRRLAARRMRTSGRDLLGYLPALGHVPLREAIARHLATARGLACAPAQVMILNSAMQAVDLVARVLLERSDRVWIEDPCYPNLRAALALSGARVTPVRVDANGLDVAQGIASASDAALVHVVPSFQYPLGSTLSLERRLALLRWAQRSGAWLIEDDYQSEFTYEGRPLAPLFQLDGGDRVLYVGSFTNAVFPSLRLAYVVLPQPLVPLFEAARRQLDDHTHGFQQAVLADFLDGGHFGAHLRRMRALYQARRDALVASCARDLPDWAALGPTHAGMNAALHLPAAFADAGLSAQLLTAGVVAPPLSRYASRAGCCNGLLLGYSALGERRIATGVATLAGVLRTAARQPRRAASGGSGSPSQ
jgi:GntR family transcriptional regulator/MocR family aminotransferase